MRTKKILKGGKTLTRGILKNLTKREDLGFPSSKEVEEAWEKSSGYTSEDRGDMGEAVRILRTNYENKNQLIMRINEVLTEIYYLFNYLHDSDNLLAFPQDETERDEAKENLDFLRSDLENLYMMLRVEENLHRKRKYSEHSEFYDNARVNRVGVVTTLATLLKTSTTLDETGNVTVTLRDVYFPSLANYLYHSKYKLGGELFAKIYEFFHAKLSSIKDQKGRYDIKMIIMNFLTKIITEKKFDDAKRITQDLHYLVQALFHNPHRDRDSREFFRELKGDIEDLFKNLTGESL